MSEKGKTAKKCMELAAKIGQLIGLLACFYGVTILAVSWGMFGMIASGILLYYVSSQWEVAID